MRVLRFTVIVFLIIFICNSRGFCQFRVIPQINLEIHLEEGYLYHPHKILLMGIGDENRVVRYVDFYFDKRNYSLYNVKPGKYLLSIVDDNADIIFQYQTVTIVYPDEDVFYRKNTGFLNEVEVHNNRNLKLKITFKMNDDDYHGYQKVMDVKYKDFDYSEFIFYSTPSSGELKTNIRTVNQVDYSICGSNNGWTENDLEFSCSLDGGKIMINIQKAYFENIYMGQKSAGYTQGGVTLGPDYSSNQQPPPLNCGVVTTTGYFLDNAGGNNPHPNQWDAITVDAACDHSTALCNIEIEYNVAIIMKTAIWKKEEMCPAKISFNNKPLYDNNNSAKSKCYCDCYLEAIIAHEAKHCESWIDSTEHLRTILNNFCSNNQNNYKTIWCCMDVICKDYADRKLKHQISGIINSIFVTSIINRPWIYSPEDASDRAEMRKFRICSRPCSSR